jgi:CheY-like chemotaxis protein
MVDEHAGKTDPTQESAERPAPDQRRTTILVVEDNDEIRDLISFVLEEEGYRTIGVADGREAVEAARRDHPDLITLDLALPGQDGWEILRDLQADPATRGIPVLVISAYTREFLAPLRERVARVISKPFYLEQIVHEVAGVLASRRPREG